MGYLKFKKASGQVDLLPAEGVMHVGTPNNTTVVLKYDANAAMDTATITFVDASGTADHENLIRTAINSSIENINGASGPAVVVNMPTLVTGIVIA